MVLRNIIAATALAFSTSVGATVFTASDDLGWETFYLDDTGGVATNSFFEIKLEEAGYADTNSFGIYQINTGAALNTQAINHLELFSGSDGVNEVAKLSWNTVTDQLSLKKSSDGIFFTDIAVNMTLDHTSFGFYLDNGNGNLFFSESKYNQDGVDHMLALQAGAEDSFVLAWEDLPGGGDRDYNDFVLLADDILPYTESVPEPATWLLMGLGLIGAGYGVRREQKLEVSKRRE